MKFLILKTKDPRVNLATEEYLFLNSDDDVFMLWQNEPTVVIGKNQNAFAELNMEYIKENNIHIVRRITGGGAVYHDLGNVNYTFISSKNSHKGIDFEYFTKPILEALSELGLSASLSGRNDILIDGRKISGNAQFTNQNTVLHHGTLLFDSDLSVLSQALKVDEEKIKSKAIKSVRSRVTNIKNYLGDYSVSDFINLIKNFIIKKFSPDIIPPPENEKIKPLLDKYSSNDWIFPNRSYVSTYQISKKKRYTFGSVDINLEMSNDVIKSIRIYGDFFGTKDVSLLESMLQGKTLHEVEKDIINIPVDEYILGMTGEELLEQIK